MTDSRQLAALLFTDIVGYTAVMQENERKAVELVKRYRSTLEKWVAHFSGQALNNYGDGSLCSFVSATQAVSCAIALQKDLRTEPAIPLRIGMHIGEVITENGQAMGDGVNVASRIQSLGQANTILISGDLQDKIRNHPEFLTVSLGSFEFKNVLKPVEVYALANEGLLVPQRSSLRGKTRERGRASARSVGIAAALLVMLAFVVYYLVIFAKPGFTGDEKSIAILPFDMIGSEEEYISDGITQEIINHLGKVADFRAVTGWASARLFKHTSKSPPEIAGELGVASLVTGTVQKDGNRLRVIAELTDARTGERIWGEDFSRSWTDVLTLQSEIAVLISEKLNARLTGDERRRIDEKVTTSLTAFENYLKGKQVINIPERDQERHENNVKAAVRYFQSAIESDSSFAPAWAWLGVAYMTTALQFDSVDRFYYSNKALAAAAQGVVRGPELSVTNAVYGDLLKSVTLSPRASMPFLERAIALNPSDADAHIFLAWMQLESGQTQAAALTLKKATELNPSWHLVTSTWQFYYSATNDIAKLRAFPDDHHLPEGDFLRSTNKVFLEFAEEQYDSLLIHANQFKMFLFSAVAYVKLGQNQKALEMINSLKKQIDSGLYDSGSLEYFGPNHVSLAIIYGWLGDFDAAGEQLELAYRKRERELISLRWSPLAQPLRSSGQLAGFFRKLYGE